MLCNFNLEFRSEMKKSSASGVTNEMAKPQNLKSCIICIMQFPPCEVDAVHLGFRLSCFTPLPLCNSKGGILTATWPTRVL